MKASIIKYLFCAGAVLVVFNANAQTKRKKQTNKSAYSSGGSVYGSNTTNNNSAYGNTGSSYGTDTTKPGGNSTSAYGAASTGVGSIDTTLPIEVITSGGGLLDSGRISLRNDAGVEQNLINDRVPMPYENIREDDAVYRVRVWRNIDTREKMNIAFNNSAQGDNGSERFISILLRGIRDGDVTAFSADDDRFTTPITFDKALNAFGSGNDTSKKYDLDGNLVGYRVSPKAVNPDSIYTFRIKEEWIFDKESSRLFVRILGIAPVIKFKLSNGDVIGEGPVWWVYYPELRKVLAKSQVYNPKNFGSNMTWEDLFESRYFSSYIVKSTIDNPFDLDFAAIYPQNTLFRLLEGERVKDKIFNYEQSLWQY